MTLRRLLSAVVLSLTLPLFLSAQGTGEKPGLGATLAPTRRYTVAVERGGLAIAELEVPLGVMLVVDSSTPITSPVRGTHIADGDVTLQLVPPRTSVQDKTAVLTFRGVKVTVKGL